MIRRLTSAPKPAARVFVYIAQQVAGAARAGRSGRRRSGRGWRTPRRARAGSRRRARAARAGAASSTTSAPSSRARSSVAWKRFSTPGSMPSPVSSSGTPIRMPRRSVAVGSAIGSGQPERGRVARVLADHRAEQQRASVTSRVSGPGLVQRGREGDHPVARDRAVGGLHPDDPAQRGGLADRAAGVGADRPRRDAGRDGGGRAARGAAGHARAVPRVQRRAVGGVLGRGAHRELVLVGLAQQRRARACRRSTAVAV